MTRLFLSGLLILTASTAFAARPSTLGMTCDEATNLVSRSHSIGLQTGKYTYGRYVSSPGFCNDGEYAHDAVVPTADTKSCRVGYTCASNPDINQEDNFGIFGFGN